MSVSKLLLLGVLLAPLQVVAANYEVQMLDYGPSGGMIFEPSFIAVQPGDTITFIPSFSGHFVRSAVVPEGAPSWQSTLDERYSITVIHEGVYVYYCPPHLTMAMVGVVQVGKAEGKDKVEAEIASFGRRIIMNKARLQTYVSQIHWSDL